MDPSTIDSWKGKAVYVLGDVMLDKFVYGRVERMSPEAPIPVLHFTNEEPMLGGAANVARNVVALGGRAILAGVVGDDEAGRLVTGELLVREGIEGLLIRTPSIPTTIKTRFVSGGQQIMRFDIEKRLQMDKDLENQLCDAFLAAIDRIDAVVLSDYAKGLLSDALVKRIIVMARERGLPIVVDPKTADVGRYIGATILKPNALEAALVTGLKCNSKDAAEDAVRTILAQAGVSSVIVTRGHEGMTVLAPQNGADQPLHISANAREVFDVSGAGDTVVATLALAIASAQNVAEAAKLANIAAGISVSKRGTSVVFPHEIRHALRTDALDQKIVDLVDAGQIIEDWKKEGLIVGFTNGCYDLLHPGHVQLLKKARQECDRLVVALNTDASVRRLKGESRPVQNETARATVMASISSVDLVTLFDEDTPLTLIESLKPDILIKGADYTLESVVGAEFVVEFGGKVVLIPLEQGHSTTSIIARTKHRGVG